MDRSKIDNLIKLSFNFHKNMDGHYYEQSPDYILEKWDKYIGVTPTKKKDVPLIENYHKKWISKDDIWDLDFDKLDSVIGYLDSINKRSIHHWSVSDLIRIFEECIGDVNEINDSPYDSLHALIKRQIVNWLNTTVNKRDYKLNLLV